MPRLSHLSASHLTLYLACSLKFRFQYLDLLPRLTKSANQVFGLAMHAALQWLHREMKRGRKPPLDEVLRVYEADWLAQTLPGSEVVFKDNDTEETFLVKGKELLSQYYANHIPKGIKAAELQFHLPLINPLTGEVLEIPIKGYVDLVEEDGTVVEFKNSARTMPVNDLADNLQLTTYAWAYETLFGSPPKDVKLVNLVRTKEPKIQTHITGRDQSDYARLFNVSKEVVNGVESGVFIPNRSSWMCQDCEYRAECDAWDGND